ncbi:MAG: Mur ligase family protein [Bacteroidota bacterium]
MPMIFYYLAVIIILLTYLLIEYSVLSKRLNRIPLRILVNGTRGKSTTVKIIYEILKENGQKVFAKTTGEMPIIIDHEGNDTKINRYAPASIIENLKLLRNISRKNPDAVILECMALQSETQHLLAKSIFKPHHTIITNIQPDHEEVMGKNIKDNYLTISQCISDDSIVYLTAETNQKMMAFGISINNTNVVSKYSCNFNLSNIPIDIVHDNWSLIKTLSTDLNIDDNITLEKFKTKWISIDHKIKSDIPDKNFIVWNLFSVNDIMTLQNIVSFNVDELAKAHDKIFFFNCRMDRPLRTIHFTEYIISNFPEAEIWLTGDGKRMARHSLVRNNIKTQNIEYVSADDVLNKIQSGKIKETHLFCIGNYKGMEEFNSMVSQLSDIKSEIKS